jgi:hypothetical protein
MYLQPCVATVLEVEDAIYQQSERRAEERAVHVAM